MSFFDDHEDRIIYGRQRRYFGDEDFRGEAGDYRQLRGKPANVGAKAPT